MAHIRKVGAAWVCEVCVDRKRRSKSFSTKREAVAWSHDQEQDGILARHTLQEALDRYIPIAESHKGWQSELSRLKSLSVIGHYSLEFLTAAKITDWRDARLKEVAPVSVRREFIVLASVLRLCRDEWGWLRNNPLQAVKKPATSVPRRRGISQEEIDSICENLDGMRQGKQVAAMFRLSIETGMRLSELLSLEWKDVQVKSVILRDTKNGDPRHVPLSIAARSIIDNRRKIDPDKVFTLTPYVASQTFRRGRGIHKTVHFHDARSEAITRLSKKLDVLQLAKMIGHRDVKSLMFYYAEKPEDIADRL